MPDTIGRPLEERPTALYLISNRWASRPATTERIAVGRSDPAGVRSF